MSESGQRALGPRYPGAAAVYPAGELFADTTASVILATVHSAKGMEFPGVVLSCTPRDDDPDLDELRRTIYVGMTRATDRLAVFAEDSHPLAEDLGKAAAVVGKLAVQSVHDENATEAKSSAAAAKRPSAARRKTGRRQSAAQADTA